MLRFLLLQPACAQFGVLRKRKGGTNFQDLQEQAVAADAVAVAGMGGLVGLDMEGLYMEKIMEMMKDPETMKAMEQMGDQFVAAMDGLSKMSPEELMQQMEEAMKMLTDGDMVEALLGNKNEILKELESADTVCTTRGIGKVQGRSCIL
jgi:hypothetical protein